MDFVSGGVSTGRIYVIDRATLSQICRMMARLLYSILLFSKLSYYNLKKLVRPMGRSGCQHIWNKRKSLHNPEI